MIHWHVSPLPEYNIVLCRGYRWGHTYEAKDPYVAVCTVLRTGENTGEAQALLSTISLRKPDFVRLQHVLATVGITHLHATRNNQPKAFKHEAIPPSPSSDHGLSG